MIGPLQNSQKLRIVRGYEKAYGGVREMRLRKEGLKAFEKY